MKWYHYAALLTLGGVLGYVLFGPGMLFAQSLISGDGVPPKLSNIILTYPTATSTLISWETDENADSEVNYGLDKNYGTIRDAFPNKKKHQILLDNLEPSMMYHLRIGSKDEGGNQALSGNYTVITKGILDKAELEKIPPEERIYVERAITSIRQIKTPEGMKLVRQEVDENAQKIAQPPVIMGTPEVADVGSDTATVIWETDQESSSVVHYARESDYRPDSDTPYTTSAGDPNDRTKEHRVVLQGLTPGTIYHFRAESVSDLGLSKAGRDATFTTKAELPTIFNFRVVKVEEDSATLAWRTNIPAAGLVEYRNMATRELKSAGSPVFASTQVVKIAGLRLGNRYQAIVKAENIVGEKVSSQAIFFTTVKDTAPPIISKVSNESTLYPTADAKVQTIVSWTTDEESFCQFFFREGLNPAIEPMGLGEEKEPRTAHVQVVVEFLPSTAYQFWVECRDSANNKTKSENFVLFTPNKEKSIIDIILENFQGTFGWVKNIGK